MKLLTEYVMQASNFHPIKLDEYLSTKANPNNIRDDEETILSGIDITKWHWERSYSNYLDKYIEIVREFARSEKASELYPNIKKCDIVEQLYRDTYKAYISIDTNKNEQEINDSYEKQMKYLNKIVRETGWGQYEYNCIEQGWWAFMYWVIEQKVWPTI